LKPKELKEYHNWVCWRTEERDGNLTKVPYHPGGWKASSTDPGTWVTYEQAQAAAAEYDGIGFVFTNSPFAGVDLDHVLDGDALDPLAAKIVAVLNSYTEVSPGGDGLHVIVKAELPDGRRRKSYDNGTKKIEMYDVGRYFTMTGNHWGGSPTEALDRQDELTAVHREIFGEDDALDPPSTHDREPLDLTDRELIEKARNADNGAKFAALWNGDTSGYPSQSEADLALCSLLAFWTQADAARIERLFSQSDLGQRDKWRDRPDYREWTIGKALQRTEVYTPPQERSQPPEPPEPPTSPAEEPPQEGEPVLESESIEDWPLFTLADAYKEREPVSYVIEGLFVQPSLNIVYGAPGCFKSLLLTEAALCVAAGTPWLETLPNDDAQTARETIGPAPALWLDFDNGNVAMHSRIEALGKARELAADMVPFYYAVMPTPWLDASSWLAMAQLTELINGMPAAMVVIDNLGTVSGGTDENSSEMVQVLANFRRVAELTGAAIVVIHHQRKGQNGGRPGDALRGHSSIEAALDLALHVDREQGSELVTIQSTKTRHADVYPCGARFSYEHKPDSYELAWARFWGFGVDDTTSDRAIRQAIKEIVSMAPGVNKTELVNEAHEGLEVSRKRIRGQIDLMVQSGKLQTEQGKHNATLYFAG